MRHGWWCIATVFAIENGKRPRLYSKDLPDNYS